MLILPWRKSAENIGFAIPINKAKKDIEQVKTIGKIVYPFLGVRYVLINDTIQRKIIAGKLRSLGDKRKPRRSSCDFRFAG